MTRIWGISDLHVDYAENVAAIDQWSNWDFQFDTLLVAGDLSDKLDLLGRTLATCRKKFARVAYVPGNHEMWVKGTGRRDSVAKWAAICKLCENEGITQSEFKVAGRSPVTVIPLLSWYETQKDAGGTLYLPKGERDETDEMWMDFHLTGWPEIQSTLDYFLSQNPPVAEQPMAERVITFSHFLPRQELMFSSGRVPPPGTTYPSDPHPAFNFSHVAGSTRIDEQLRAYGSILHLYGHQHRNRAFSLDGVTYVSHCMGYPRERSKGLLRGPATHPRALWDTELGSLVLIG
ncbi:Conserved hypothetical protein [gamma proteobacterium HdN1]|nr:Conserved hypothetical protein [gamma proteobacterium HdN1]